MSSSAKGTMENPYSMSKYQDLRENDLWGRLLVLAWRTQCTATAPAVHCNRLCSALDPSLQCTAFFGSVEKIK